MVARDSVTVTVNAAQAISEASSSGGGVSGGGFN